MNSYDNPRCRMCIVIPLIPVPNSVTSHAEKTQSKAYSLYIYIYYIIKVVCILYYSRFGVRGVAKLSDSLVVPVGLTPSPPISRGYPNVWKARRTWRFSLTPAAGFDFAAFFFFFFSFAILFTRQGGIQVK